MTTFNPTLPTPRFRREVWCNVYADGCEFFDSQEEANAYESLSERLALKRIVIEGAVGDAE